MTIRSKSCLLLMLLSAQLFTGLLTGYSASAASAYDTNIQLHNKLEYWNTAGTNSTDISLDWLQKLQAVPAAQGFSNQATTDWNNAINTITTSGAGGGAVTYFANDTFGDSEYKPTTIYIGAKLDTNSVRQVLIWNGTVVQTYFDTLFAFEYDSNGNENIVRFSNPGLYNISQQSPGRKLIMSTANPNWPTGYDGQEVPDTYSPIEKYVPHVEYVVNGTKITARYTDNLAEQTQSNALSFNWSVAKELPEGAFQEMANSNRGAGPPPMQQSILDDYQFDVKEYGTYSLNLYNGTLTPLIEGVEVETAIILLEIDGSSFTGSTRDMECVEGICTPASIYEDCDLADLGCHFRNFGVFLKAMLIGLFIPNGATIKTKFDAMMVSLVETLGFLGYPVIFMVDVLQAMQANTGGFGGVLNFGNFFGSNVSIDVGALQNLHAGLFDLVMNIIRGSIVLGLIFILRRKYLEVVQA